MPHLFPRAALSVIGFLLCASGASIAADKSATAEAAAVYQQDRAACNSGQSTQDRATCLREAGAAHEQAKSGKLNNATNSFQENAMARCSALSGAERDDCANRAKGGGISSGSVGSGGIITETRTLEAAPAANSPAAK